MDSSDIADGILPDTVPVHIGRRVTGYRAWHKVRKQFVRKHQWNELIKQLVNADWRSTLQKPSDAVKVPPNSTMHVSEPLRCLVIPGDDLLDIRSLWNVISPLDCYIRYLGFNEVQGSQDEGTRVFVANNAVTSLPGVISDSQVLRDRFESIARESPGFAQLKRYGPYHVVNLDLCGSLMPNNHKPVEPYITAINRLLSYQFANQKTSWLFFVVTMVEPAMANAAEMARLCIPTRKNYDSNPAFAEAVASLFPASVLKAPDRDAEVTGISEEEMIRLFGVAFGKWLLHLSHSASPEWTVRMRQIHRYQVDENAGAVMLSLAFQFKPNFAPPVDPTGISTLSVLQSNFPSEAEMAVKVAQVVGAIRDVDEELAAKGELRQQLQNESADLMESAGYDRTDYLKWVAEGELSDRQQLLKEQTDK